MKKLVVSFLTLFFFFFLVSCSKTKAPDTFESFVGTFITDTGITFTLNADSTSNINYAEGIDYKGTWEMHQDSEGAYVNIEFYGNKQYYFFRNDKIYRSRTEMHADMYGNKVTYIK